MLRRNTVQKQLVLDAVIKMHRHVNADEVFNYVKNNHPTISKGTVYRNLSLLVSENKIRRIEVSNGSDCYDYRIDKHYHFRCLNCGKLYDLEMNELKDLSNYINNSAMDILDYDIIFKGICLQCKGKESK